MSGPKLSDLNKELEKMGREYSTLRSKEPNNPKLAEMLEEYEKKEKAITLAKRYGMNYVDEIKKPEQNSIIFNTKMNDTPSKNGPTNSKNINERFIEGVDDQSFHSGLVKRNGLIVPISAGKSRKTKSKKRKTKKSKKTKLSLSKRRKTQRRN